MHNHIITGLSPVLTAQLRRMLSQIEPEHRSELSPQRAAIRLAAVADGLRRADPAATLCGAVAGLASRPLLVIAAAIAIAAINAHDSAELAAREPGDAA